MAGISDKALKSNYAENKWRYNGGSELQNKEFSDGSGLEAYDANFRMYDPQLGRFWQQDPLAELSEDWSPYAFAQDNPILLNDPLGLISDSSHPQELDAAYVTAARKKTHSSPDVAAAAGPAPTRVAPPIQSEEEKEKHAAAVKAIGYDIYDFQYQQNQVVVRQPTFWENLLDEGDGGKLVGYNFRGNAVRTPLTILTPNPWLMPDGPPGAGAARAGRELFEFTATAARHMGEVGRMVPIQILNEIIKAPMAVVKDPQGTRALMYYSQMSRNGKLYNVEVLYDKAANLVMHFKYSREAMGPLAAIPK